MIARVLLCHFWGVVDECQSIVDADANVVVCGCWGVSAHLIYRRHVVTRILWVITKVLLRSCSDVAGC